MNIKNNFFSFIKSFKYAFEGILYSVKSERNLRIHLCATFYVLIFMQFYDFSTTQKSVIILLIALVISLEMVNSAIEKVVDICSPQYSKLAKAAKDISSAAVLISAISATIIAVMYFWDIAVFLRIYHFFLRNYLLLVGLIISVVLWIIFIFGFNTTNKAVEN